MASKKKARGKKSSSSKKSASSRLAKRSGAAASRKKSANAKSSRAKAKSKTKTRSKPVKVAQQARTRRATGSKAAPRDTARVFRSSIPTRGESQGIEIVDLDSAGRGPKFGGQSGDLQGLSNLEGADSESVGELLEEGNAFEAEVVKGVEDVRDADQGEVRTHQKREELELDEDFREN
jgi:hypothetical protein